MLPKLDVHRLCSPGARSGLLLGLFFFKLEEGFVYSVICNIMFMETNFNFSHVYHILKINLRLITLQYCGGFCHTLT